MTNRRLIYLVRDQKPLVLRDGELVRTACQAMWQRRAGSVLVVDDQDRLVGIFTGRDAVRLLGNTAAAAAAPLSQAMTPNPVTSPPQGRAADALRAMIQGGFRHVPVTQDGKILGVVSRADFKGMEFEEYRWNNVSQTPSEANRTLSAIIEQQQPLILSVDHKVAEACRLMSERKTGSALVADKRQRLKGIFTGRDAVRVLAKAKDAAGARLAMAMTSDPATMAPQNHAIDALRLMNDCGFRHVPVVSEGRICGVVSRNDFTGVEIDRLDQENHLMERIW
ncbi:MAG TPA: CBS domain-containing protein [Hyphomicrobium sp.]|nr:CBS domain-containing protein [Hyphomicrobium sp.]